MKPISVLLICMMIILTGCSSQMLVLVRFLNIAEHSEDLKLLFQFRNLEMKENIKVNRITVYKSDEMVLEISTSYEKGIKSWVFPSIPDNFHIDYSKPEETLNFKKTDILSFYFSGSGSSIAYGEWHYWSDYSVEKFRSLFDSSGNLIYTLEFYQRGYSGNSISIINYRKPFIINEDSSSVIVEGQLVPFTIPKSNTPSIYHNLKLKRKFKKTTTVDISLLVDGIHRVNYAHKVSREGNEISTIE